MALEPISVARELTPNPVLAAPAGFTTVDEPLVDGLPLVIPLGDLTGVLIVPTGLALAWRDADPAEAVTASAGSLAPVLPGGGGTGTIGRPPARLMVLQGDEVIGSLPLVAGRRAGVGDSGRPPGVLLEVLLLAWDLRAGTMGGPGDTGAGVKLAWRRADAAPDAFTSPAVHPRVLAREAPTPGGSA